MRTPELWRHEGEPDWWRELRRTRLEVEAADPLALQIRNLCDVARGTAQPVMTAREGMEPLRPVLTTTAAVVGPRSRSRGDLGAPSSRWSSCRPAAR